MVFTFEGDLVRCAGAGVGFEGFHAEGFEPGEQFVQAAVVVDPGLVVAVLVGAEPAKAQVAVARSAPNTRVRSARVRTVTARRSSACGCGHEARNWPG
jgi:hypothetical protein